MNAKTELLDHVSKDNIKCAFLEKMISFYDYREYILKQNHTSADLKNFLKSLDFHYNHGYGTQKLHGKVWLKDGTWLERMEYDGSEWWEHKKLPVIPKECLEDSEETV